MEFFCLLSRNSIEKPAYKSLIIDPANPIFSQNNLDLLAHQKEYTNDWQTRVR